MLLSYISGLIDGSIANTKQAPSAYVGITNIFLLSLFIMASAPSSGGHVNPTISLATMTAGLTSFSRGTPPVDALSAVLVARQRLIYLLIRRSVHNRSDYRKCSRRGAFARIAGQGSNDRV